jgi:hypothetical protein
VQCVAGSSGAAQSGRNAGCRARLEKGGSWDAHAMSRVRTRERRSQGCRGAPGEANREEERLGMEELRAEQGKAPSAARARP